MPPKKKKGTGKKSGKGKKGKKGEPQITFKEAILAYRIGLVEKQIEELKFEENSLIEKKERCIERNDRLKSEQEEYIKLLLKQAKEFDKKNRSSEKIGKEQVKEALDDKWLASKEEDAKLESMKNDILNIEKVILNLKAEVKIWFEYKKVGSVQRARQIELLEKELKDMHQSYEEMSEQISRNVEITRENIIIETQRALDDEKHNASEKAMSTLDKKDRQEVLDNDWMKEEVDRYRKQCEELSAVVESLEKENLDMMSNLFECNVEDLKITRNMFLTQFQEGESLEDGGILEVDLRKISLIERHNAETELAAIEGVKQLAITEGSGDYVIDHPANLQSEDEEEDYDGQPATPDSHSEDPFNNYYNFTDEDMTEYLQLGPLELKMLNLTGIKAPLHIKGGLSKDTRLGDENGSDWPVTQPMLKGVVTPR